MPYESDNQRKAMHAAASGNSTIGIPQSVGKKFVADSGGASHQSALRGSKYGNYTESYGNSTHNGTHHTHWKNGKKYGGSMTGEGSIGGASMGGGGGGG